MSRPTPILSPMGRWAWLACLIACGPAGGPEGRALRLASTAPLDAGFVDVGTSSTAPDAGFLPDCAQPNLASLREEIFLKKCALSGCHISGEMPPTQNLDLSLPQAELIQRLMQPAAQSPSGMPLITPGRKGASYLYLKVFLESPLEGASMPPNGRLEACELMALERWIERGASD